MNLRLVLGVFAVLGIAGATGCSSSNDARSLAAVRNDMQTLTQSHYETSLRITDPRDMLEETRHYADAMHGLLGQMQDLCNSMRHSETMMGGHSWEDMNTAMGHMSDAVDQHLAHMQDLDDIEAMHQECDSYRQAFMHDLDDLDGAMHGDGDMDHDGHMGH